MKTISLWMGAGLLSLGMAAGLPGQAPAVPATPAKGKTAGQLYDEGRAAYFREDFATAKAKLTQVLRVSPNHTPTIAMLKNIQMAEAAAARQSASVRSRLERTMLPRLDLSDAKVPEAIDFLQLKAAEAAGPAGRPNFIIKLDPVTEKQTVTLKLGRTSVYDALRALATVARLELVFDQYAVQIRPLGSEPAATEPAKRDGVAKDPRTPAPPAPK
jgi:hypothetical protein